MPEKWVITVYAISHGRSIFAHIQVGELGGSEGWGESRYTGRKSVHGKIVAVYLPIVGLTDLWAYFALSKRCSIWNVNSKKCKQN